MEGTANPSPTPEPHRALACDDAGQSSPFSRQWVTITKQERIDLVCRANYWEAQHARARSELEKLRQEAIVKDAKIKDLQNRLFGKKSEKQSRLKSKKDGKDDTPSRRRRGQQPGSQGHGRTKRPDLPIVEDEIDLADEEKRCSTCGLPHLPTPALDEHSQLIAEDPARTPAELSRLTCRALQWLKADGGLKDMSARVAMLRMHDDGLIAFPAPRCQRPDPRVRIGSRSDPEEPLDKPAQALTPLALRRVRQKSESRLWNEFVERYHCLGHKPLPGARLRYLVYSGEQPIALLGFGAAAWMSAPRDRYIGWTHQQRQRHLHLIVNNARFLILPWIQSKNLASMLLAKAARILTRQWQEVYGYRPVLLETFVEKPRFQGTCYKAAHWLCLGQTKGRGKLGPAGKQSLPIKGLWVYPLGRHFRETLTR